MTRKAFQGVLTVIPVVLFTSACVGSEPLMVEVVNQCEVGLGVELAVGDAVGGEFREPDPFEPLDFPYIPAGGSFEYQLSHPEPGAIAVHVFMSKVGGSVYDRWEVALDEFSVPLSTEPASFVIELHGEDCPED